MRAFVLSGVTQQNLQLQRPSYSADSVLLQQLKDKVEALELGNTQLKDKVEELELENTQLKDKVEALDLGSGQQPPPPRPTQWQEWKAKAC